MCNIIIFKKFVIITWVLILALLNCSENGTGPDNKKLATINLNNTQQLIRGFGAANILPWRPDMTIEEVNKAFGTGNGQIGFSMLRLRIPPDTSEFSLNVPTSQLAHSMGVTIIASPWSPPSRMKTNNDIVGGSLSDSSYASYAAHLKSFVDYMADKSVPIYAISVQNEPDVSVSYESCDWSPSQMLKFIKENAHSIGTKIIAPESFQFRREISDPLLNDPSALTNFDIIGGHIYGGGLRPYPLAESKGKEIWMTEHLELATEWLNNLDTGKEILDCMNAGMSAYIWWYIVRFYGPIYDDGSHPSTPTESVQSEISKRGYVFSQFARFIRPGFFRIGVAENPQDGVYLTAFKSGSRVVLVAINDYGYPVDQTFKIKNDAITNFTPYVTSETKNCIQETDVALSNNSFTATLDGWSVTTFVSH